MVDVTRVDYRRRLAYHAKLLEYLDSVDWAIVIENLNRAEAAVSGDRARSALLRWLELVDARDLPGMAEVFRAATDEADLMRSISPFAGVLPESDRLAVLSEVRREPVNEAPVGP